MDKLINELEAISLEGKDVIKMIGGSIKTKYIEYDSLKHYKNIGQLFTLNVKAILILLMVKGEGQNGVGHFVALFKNKEGINYFDPYALGLEEDLHITHEPGYLLELLKDVDYKENKNRYQSQKNDIATCGRHVAVRLKFHNLNDSEYSLMMKSKNNPDYLVSILTLFLTRHEGVDILKETKQHLGGTIGYHPRIHEGWNWNNNIV